MNGPIQPLSWAFTDTGRRRIRSIPIAPGRCSTKPAGRQRRPTPSAQKDGKPLTFTLITQAGFAIRENVAQALQRQWRDVGVEARIQLHDGTTISSVWFAGKFDAMLHWWHMPADPELTLFFAADRTPPAGRNINYVDDAVADEAAVRVGPDRRA